VKTYVKKSTNFTPTHAVCKFHPECDLIHISCQATIIMCYPIGNKCVIIKNKGNHSHPHPPKIRPSAKALTDFEAIVRNAPEATPLHLSVGNKTQSPVRDLVVSLANIDRVRYHYRRIKSENNAMSDIGVLASIDAMNPGLTVSSSLKSNDGHVIIQTPGMKEVMLQKANALQTDTIMGFVKDKKIPTLNVTCTSTFSETLQCYVPVLVGILFGMSAIHYQRYFNALIECHNFNNCDDFCESWPGNICDFSDSKRKGFRISVQEYFDVKHDDDIELSNLFSACKVHFDCS